MRYKILLLFIIVITMLVPAGIEYFTSLITLEAYYNNLTELDVSMNTALEEPIIFSNQLTKLNLGNNTALEHLECSNNDLPDQSAITGLSVDRHISLIYFPQRAYSPKMETASEWARPEILRALGMGFVEQDIQENFAGVITRLEFCRMAVMFLECALEKDFYEILIERVPIPDPDTIFATDRPYINSFQDTSDLYVLTAYLLGITNGT